MKLSLTLLTALLLAPLAALHAAEKPNIILIMADDLGWQEPGFAGSDFCEIPHLDRLAREWLLDKQAGSGDKPQDLEEMGIRQSR